MTMGELRKYRRVPAKRGMRVIANGEPGVISSNIGDSLRIKLDGEKRARGRHHPLWEMVYLAPDGSVLADYRELAKK